MSVLDVLVRGRERISNGWCQNALRINNSYCAVGATMDFDDGYGASTTSESMEARNILRMFVPISGDKHLDLVNYNNAPERKHKEVIELFDRAIEYVMPDAGLTGPSRRITVEPIEVPDTAPEPMPVEPDYDPDYEPSEAPSETPHEEPVPA